MVEIKQREYVFEAFDGADTIEITVSADSLSDAKAVADETLQEICQEQDIDESLAGHPHLRNVKVFAG